METSSSLESGSNLNWSSSKAVNDAILNFYHNKAQRPNINEERALHNRILNAIKEELAQEGIGASGVCQRAEYSGSSYSGVNIPRCGAEFDVLLVLKGGEVLSQEELPGAPGYHKLTVTGDNNPFPKYVDPNGALLPNRVREAFMGRLQQIINNLPKSVYNRDLIKLRAHGPAIQMDVYNESGKKLYSVDLVPTFEINGNQYVAKSFKEEEVGRFDIPGAWRKSHSLEEKRMFNKLDKDNTCRKMALRTCKAMLADRDELKVLSSHHLKQALFHEIREHPEADHWKPANLPERVLDIWHRIERYAADGKMPCYFDDRVNLIENLTPQQRELVECRIKRIGTNEKVFRSVLESLRTEQISGDNPQVPDLSNLSISDSIFM